MRKSLICRILFLCVFAGLSAVTFAQSKTNQPSLADNKNANVTTPVYHGTLDVLWDNFLTQSTTAIVSDEWGGLPVGSNETLSADDFVVTSGEAWTIDEISSTGFYSAGSAESDTWGVQFFEDAGGSPGALIATETVTVVTGVTDPQGVLSNPVVLQGGHYWISIYGINNTASTLAAFRWNWYTSEDPGVGYEPYLNDMSGLFGGTSGWESFTSVGIGQYANMMFQLLGTSGAGVGPGPATSPDPADGAADVDIDQDISWTNPAGATSIEIFFGPTGNMTSVYSGAPISTFDVGTLDYMTGYTWKVNETDGTGTTSGTVWSFTTMQDPNLITLMMDDFEAGGGNWTLVTTSGCGWDIYTDPAITGRYTLPAGAGGAILAADADNCGSGGGGASGTATLTDPIDASQYASVAVEWDNDWRIFTSADTAHCQVSTDGGTTWMNVVTFGPTSVRNTHEYYNISSMVGGQSFMLRFVSVQPGWDYFWAIDNVMVTGWDVVPVELSSFTANVSNGNVVLSWITATETNNKGFEVQRSSGSDYQTIAFIQGNGTSTQQHSYTYSDQNVTDGSYSYRLRQVDFDGSSAYSQVVEVNVEVPKVFSLAQNYPNPFNPTTQINFSLATDSKVTLKVFDILGQEVATLLNGNLLAGPHFVNFDASKLTSGVYLYRMDATGADGSNFTAIKKMLLTK